MTITVTRGRTMVAGEVWDVSDWNAAFLPNVVISGGVVGSDIEDGAITPAKLNSTVFSGLTAETALATADRVPFWDASASANKYITVGNALNGVFSLAPAVTAFTSYSADVLTLHNGTAAGTMTVARAAENLVAQAPSLASTADADEVLVHDASATAGSRAARVTLANLLPDKATAGTYAFPASIVVDAKGRITSITAGASSGGTQAGSDTALPSVGSDISFAWASGTPKRIDVFYVCTEAHSYWQVGDTITLDTVRCYDGSDVPHQGMMVYYHAANAAIRITRASTAASLKYPLPKGQGGTPEVMTEAKWKLRVIASV